MDTAQDLGSTESNDSQTSWFGRLDTLTFSSKKLYLKECLPETFAMKLGKKLSLEAKDFFVAAQTVAKVLTCQ